MAAHVPPHTDERELLLAFLDQQRHGIRNAALGLTDDEARRTPTLGALSIGGLVKHAVKTERYWVELAVPGSLEAGATINYDYETGFLLLPDEKLSAMLEAYADVATHTDRVMRDAALTDPVPVPRGAPWFPADVDAWSVRWVLLHLIEETARHAGHADIVRESIDGATMYPLMAAAEGWPATDWLTPWAPAS